MKTITGKLEFFTELSITAAVVRADQSRGGFDGCLAISPGDQLTVKSSDGKIIFQTESVVPNYEIMKSRHSAVIIPQGLSYDEWMDMLRGNLKAELIKKGSSFY
jgi:hypothetical protein